MANVTPGDPLAPPDPLASDALFAGPDAAPGALGRLGNNYEILEIKRGGMGEVYICRSVSEDGPRLAFKTYQKRFFFNRATRSAFEREVSVWIRLTGLEHIMPAAGLHHFNGLPFVLMPAVGPGPSGEVTLRDLLRRGPLPIDLALRFAGEAARGLGYAEERIPGLVHGDLKPENLLVWDGMVHVSDFGLARIVTDPDSGEALEATWAYRAPELWEKGKESSHASDVYAFGALFYEMLTGTTPFSATTREGWERAHREDDPRLPEGFPVEGTMADAMNLALRALAKRPEDRPSGFAAIAEQIVEIDPASHLMHLLSRARKAAEESQNKQHEPREDRERGILGLRVRNLLEHGEAQQALAELDAAPPDLMNAELIMTRGTALSLLDRDEEALHCFEAVLRDDLSTEMRQGCLSELALSLKRLKRFDEAIRIYTDLLAEVPEDRVEGVVSNLGTVYLEAGRPKDAVDCLRPFARKHPESYHAWANLGKAHKDLKQYAEAETALKCALRAAPSSGLLLVLLAEVHLLQKQLPTALAALNHAYQQGYTSRRWLVALQACYLVLGEKDRFDALREQVGADVPPRELEELDRDILELTQMALAEPTDAPSDAEAEGSAADDEPAPPAEHDAAPEEAQGFSMPFVNLRFIMGEGAFVVDFYDDVQSKDYPSAFLRVFRRVTRDHRISSTLRETPFYFTLCRHCELVILTNRDRGRSLRCRRCDHRHETTPITDRADLSALLREVTEAIGKKPATTTASAMVVVLLKPLQDGKMDRLNELAEQAGFDPISAHHPAAMSLRTELLKRGALAIRDEYVAYQRRADGEPMVYEGDTPPVVERLLREVYSECGPVVSASLTYDPTSTALGDLFLQDRLDDTIAALRAQVAESPGNVEALSELIHVLTWKGDLAEARAYAELGTRAYPESAYLWSALGMVEQRLGRAQEAAAACETALRLDPLDRIGLVTLILVYRELGRGAEAAELHERLESFGAYE
ncbi:protein kinase [Polyangium sp. 6x1]|uniref:protein kinase domain-containing protein n=1 Tax=Polyangium sp. 6x1 TaxID=3042689 RepID=UPI0024828DEF|nr:protein kinase [Polyangium sp. 6x1]MDI1442461.1 protein kinase [Polyangium sp. 6x1]